MLRLRWAFSILALIPVVIPALACRESDEPAVTPEPTTALTGGLLATFNVEGEQFALWTTNAQTIDQILALERGESTASIPNGPLRRGAGDAGHNAPWSWHLDPLETSMADVTIEVCDGLPSYVEEHLDEFVDTVGQYCPWAAELIEVSDFR